MSRIHDPRSPRSASRLTRQSDRDRSSRSRRAAIRRRLLAERLETRRLLASDVFINEFHYDNVGTDTGEFIEIAGPAGQSIDGWRVELYNGSNQMPYGTVPLMGTLDDEGNGGGALAFTDLDISPQNGSPDGLALVDDSGQVVEFISYEGTFTAVDGPADGLTSVDIGVSEPSTTPVGESLQRTGSGAQSNQFSWLGPLDESPGVLNVGQTYDPDGSVAVSSFVLLNEILFDDPTGPDDDTTSEFIELRGDPGTKIGAGTYLVNVEGDASSGFAEGIGKVANIFDVSDLTFGANGYLVLGQSGNGYGPQVDADANFLTSPGSAGDGFSGFGFFSTDVSTAAQLENPSNNLLLIRSPTPPTLGDDVDTDDDGTADGVTWESWNVLDSVSISDGDSGDGSYGQVVFAKNATADQIATGVIDAGNDDLHYVARIGERTGSAAGDWMAGSLSGSESSGWSLSAGTAIPTPFDGQALDHIGSANPEIPVLPVPSALINEFVANHTGVDTDSFVEILAAPNTDLAALTLVEIDGDDDSAGEINSATRLGVTDSNGYFTFGNNPDTTEPVFDLQNGTDLENGTNTLLLVGNFTGSAGDDLDTDDDGVLDTMPWTDVVDEVGVSDGDPTDRNYTSVVLPVGFDSAVTDNPFSVGGASRIPDGRDTDSPADWLRNDFGGDGLPSFGETFTAPVGTAINTAGGENFANPATADVLVVETGESTQVSEAGLTDTFEVSLATNPDFTVTVTLTPDGQLDLGGGAGTAIELTFDTRLPQNVTVTAVDDEVLENAHSGQISFSVTSSDADYGGIAVAPLEVAIADNEANAPPTVINEFVANHAGDDIDAFVELFSSPAAALSSLSLVEVSGDEGREGVINSVTSFTSADSSGYAVVENDFANGAVTLLLVEGFRGGVGDDLDTDDDGTLDATPWLEVRDEVATIDDGDVAYTSVTLLPGSDGDPFQFGGASRIPNGSDTDTVDDWVRNDFSGEGLPEVTGGAASAGEAINTPGGENVVAVGAFAIESDGSTRVIEGGAGDTIEIGLATVPTNEPDSDVTVTVTPDGQLDLGAGAGTPVVLTFTGGDAGNFDTNQTVAVDAVDDTDAEGGHSGELTFTVASADASFDGLTIDPITVAITDDEIPSAAKSPAFLGSIHTGGDRGETEYYASGNDDNFSEYGIASFRFTPADFGLAVNERIDSLVDGEFALTINDRSFSDGNAVEFFFTTQEFGGDYGPLEFDSQLINGINASQFEPGLEPVSLGTSTVIEPGSEGYEGGVVDTLSLDFSGLTESQSQSLIDAINAGEEFSLIMGVTDATHDLTYSGLNNTFDPGDPVLTLNVESTTVPGTFVSIRASNDASESGPVDGQLTVNQVPATPGVDTVVSYGVTGTATAGDDYAALSGSVTIPAGETSAAITVDVLDDAVFEGSEVVTVTLQSITSGDASAEIVASQSSATLAIEDDDDPAVSDVAVINEFVADHTGADSDAFVEILTPDATEPTDLGSLTLLQIEGDFSDSGTAEGTIDTATPLGITDAAGYLTLDLDAENGTVTLLLVKDFTGAVGDDLDDDDDGLLDATPWSAIVDAVATVQTAAEDLVYADAPALVPGLDGNDFQFGGASRIPDGTDTDTVDDWVRNDFDGAGLASFPDATAAAGEAINTPGAVNAAVADTPPTVESVVINEGGEQRSSITQVTVTFSTVVSIDDESGDPFRFVNLDSSTTVVDTASVSEVDGKTVVEFTFAPGASVTDGGSLADGDYRLTIDASLVTAGGSELDGDGDGDAGGDFTFVDDFFRKYGDQNGSGLVELLDFAAFRRTFGRSAGDDGYLASLDADGNDTIDLLDFAAFRRNFGS